MKKIFVIFVVCMTMVSCDRWKDLKESQLTPLKIKNPQELFATETTPGVYNGGMLIYKLDKKSGQVSLNKKRQRFLLQSDDCLVQMCVIYDSLQPVGGEYKASVTLLGIEGYANGEKQVKVVKKSNNMAWLWNEKDQLGYLIYTSLDFL